MILEIARLEPEMVSRAYLKKATVVLKHKNNNRSKVSEDQKGTVQLIISGGSPAKPLELLKKVFHRMALLVKVPIHL